MVCNCRPKESMNRFFVDKKAVKEEGIEITDKEDLNHIRKVLRLGEGDFIEISDSTMYEYVCCIDEVSDRRVFARIHDKQSFSKEPALSVTLFQGIPKQGKMETIIQKAVELGVHEIVPVFTQRTVVAKKDNFSNKLERWQKVSAEAVKQCKRGIVPKVTGPLDFKSMAGAVDDFDLTLFLYENEERTNIKQVLRKAKGEGKAIRTAALLIGPEGGFSDEEAEILKGTSACCAALGKTILRTETAGIAAMAMVMYELELED